MSPLVCGSYSPNENLPGVVLGYSGLDGAARFRARWLGEDSDPASLRMYQGQDAAATLVIDGEVVAAVQQERFSGQKFDGDFPREAIAWCLESAGLRWADVTAVAHNFDFSGLRPLLGATPLGAALFDRVYAPDLQTVRLHELFPEAGDELRVTPVPHHLAHAYLGATASGFDEAGVLVTDGMGEAQAISVYRWRDGSLHRVATWGPSSSLGLWFSLITAHLGFLPNMDEYKVMGLAPFGDPTRFAAAIGQTVQFLHSGLTVPLLSWADGNHRYTESRRWLAERTIPTRAPGEHLTQDHADLAAAAQQRLSQALEHLALDSGRRTGSRRIVICGGVALNCAAIGDIAAQGRFEAVYVPPAPGDDGTAIGAALAITPARTATMPRLPLLGPRPTWGSRQPTPDWVAADSEQLASVVARILAAGAVVGWARGRLEFGPRALGSRSILASPATAEMRDRVNAVIKEREAFRPLAPAVLAERVNEWFDVPSGLNVRHMTAAVQARAERRDQIAAVVHVDGTSRIQSVHQQDSADFWRLLRAFEQESGLPMLLNTSLNSHGQPIARTADDAYGVFRDFGLDAVVIEDGLWLKPTYRERLASWLKPKVGSVSG